MSTHMMTCNATAKDTENKLKRALLGLKQCKEENTQLLTERLDCEEDIKNVNNNVSKLKSQLVELHIQLMDVSDQRDRLQDQIVTNSHNSDSAMDKLKEIHASLVEWKSIRQEGLDIEYSTPIPRTIASNIFKELEETLEYFTGDLSRIKVFGKVYPLPRQQVAYGDPGITYTYSGITVPALPWPASVLALRDFLFALKGIKYDFVLVNKYRNGNDHMGEHRDNEPDLDRESPIASISLGQERTFVLKHKDARKSGKDKKPIPAVKIELEHGSVLLMNPPTNEIWYHSLPARKKLLGPRINLTFRKMRRQI